MEAAAHLAKHRTSPSQERNVLIRFSGHLETLAGRQAALSSLGVASPHRQIRR